MKKLIAATIPGLLLTCAGRSDTVNFDDVGAGKLPAHWTGSEAGKGESRWAVIADDSAPSKPNALKKSGEAACAVLIKKDTSIKDGFVEVKFNAVSGNDDRAGGIIWRCQDADNYYIACANALENSITIYYTLNGSLTEMQSAQMKVSSKQWHTLRVDFRGPHSTVSLDGKKAIEWDDETFRDAGKIGLWSKADSVTLFDNFTYGGK
jgi:hypothetical protein